MERGQGWPVANADKGHACLSYGIVQMLLVVNVEGACRLVHQHKLGLAQQDPAVHAEHICHVSSPWSSADKK